MAQMFLKDAMITHAGVGTTSGRVVHATACPLHLS
jgi:hypothetical protein